MMMVVRMMMLMIQMMMAKKRPININMTATLVLDFVTHLQFVSH